MADRELTAYEAILAHDMQAASVSPDIERLPAAPAATGPAKEGPGFRKFAGAVIDSDWAPAALGRLAAEAGIPQDLEWDVSQIPEPLFQEMVKGIPEEYVEDIADRAWSEEHLHALIADTRRAMDNEKIFEEAGGWGVAGRILGNVADPTNVILAASTGGLGVMQKADRLRRAATATGSLSARKAAAAELGKVSSNLSTRNALLVGGTAAAESMALESILVAADPTRDGWDIAYAGLGAAAFGGTVGKLMSRGEQRLAQEWSRRATLELEAEEFAAEVARRREDLIGKIGDVDAARATSGRAVGEAAAFLAERDVAMGDDYTRFLHALESNGRADAVNAASSATGVDQFIESTWLSLVRKAKPQWAEGLSKDELLAQRLNPERSAEMRRVLDAENQEVLRKANAPVNHFTMYAMHHFGPKRGVRFAHAAPGTKMEDILSPGQMDANAYLKGLTKAEALQNWAERARRAGALDLRGALGSAGESLAERTAVARRGAIDTETASARITELEAELEAHNARVAQLREDAKGEIPSGELRKLERKVDKLERELRGHRGEPSAATGAKLAKYDEALAKIDEFAENLRARYLEEDVRKLGADVARNKQRTKLRESAVKRAAKEEKKRLEARRREVSHDYRSRRYALREALTEPKARLEAGRKAEAAKKTLSALLRDDPTARIQGEGKSLREALGLAEELDGRIASAASRRTEVDDFVRATEGTRADLDRLDQLDTVGEAAAARQEGLKSGEVSAFGADSLSAARAVGIDVGLYPSLEEVVDSATAAKMKFGDVLNLWGAGTFAGLFRGSDNPVVRKMLGPLVGNALGNADDSAVEVGASEIASQMTKRYVGQFNTAINGPYREWMTEAGIPGWRQWNRKVRSDFMKELGLHIRGQESASPAIQKAATGVRKIFAGMLDEAKAAGVKGFENVVADDNWLPRVFDFHRFYDLRKKHGGDQLEMLITGAIKQRVPDLDDAIAKRIGAAYIRRMSELRMGNDANMMQGMVFDDVVFLRQFLEEMAFDKAEIEEVAARFAGAKLSKGGDVFSKEGDFRNAKSRVKFDENFGLRMVDPKSPTAERFEVRVSDLLENNVEALFGRYVRSMSGHIGLAKVGIKSRADWTERMNAVARALENDPNQWKNVSEKAELAYSILTARPIENATLLQEMGRTGREIAFATQMENVGLSNVPDLASLLAWGNFRYVREAFFSGEVFGALWKRGSDGKLTNDLLREVEETTGLGTDYLNNTIFTAYDVGEEHAEALVTGKAIPRALSKGLSNIGHGARVASRAVTAGSGLGAITAGAQRLAANVIIHRIKDDVLKGGRFSDARAAALGLDEAMKKRVAAQLGKHVEWVKGDTGGRIQRLAFEKWTDTEARDTFLYAVMREARKNVQEEDLGDTLWWQHTGWGKVISQFRRFAMTAWTKQTLRGLTERDAETATRVALQFVMAAGVWELRHQVAIAGMEAAGVDPAKIEKYREEKLAPDRIVAAGIRNSGVASLLPDAFDTASGLLVDETFFDVRNSGNSSKLLEGIPLVGVVGSMGNAAGAVFQSVIRGDRQFTKNDARAVQALVPFGHHLVVQPVFEALTADLPERDEDDDPDSFDWF